MKEKVKMVHQVKGTKLVVHRVRYNGRLAWIDLNGKVWPGQFVEYGPEVKS